MKFIVEGTKVEILKDCVYEGSNAQYSTKRN